MELVYLLAILLFGTIITFISSHKIARIVSFSFSLIAFVYTLSIFEQISESKSVISYVRPWLSFPKIEFNLFLNGKSLLFVVLTNLLVPIIILSSTIQGNIKSKKSFYSLILLMQFALCGTFLANDSLLFYIFWEIALIPIYFIALLWGDEDAKKSTLTFFLYTLFGSLFLLIGLIVLQSYGNFLNENPLFVFGCIAIAFLIKIPVFPFHSWQANVYKSAPMVGSMLLSGIMLKMGFWGIYRWLLPYFPTINTEVFDVVLILGMIGVFYGAILAINQGDLKRLLAYSSFSHVGLITMGLFVFNSSGNDGAFIQSFAHGINIVALFYIAEIIYDRTQTYRIKNLGGLWRKAPVFSALALTIVLASIAMPLTNSFVGEFLLLNGIFDYNCNLGIIATLSVIFGAVYMLRMYQRAFLGKTNLITQQFNDVSTLELVILLVFVVLIFVFGVYPKILLDLLTIK
jgi:NADH-quinone oxidoreductase subunit M